MLQMTLYRGEEKKKMEQRRFKAERRQPFEPVMIHRTIRSDRGPGRSIFFSHGMVLHLKWTVEVDGLRVSWSDRTVQFGFKNLAVRVSGSCL